MNKSVQDALNEVNVFRSAMGAELLLKMPKGVLYDGYRCPIHNALEPWVISVGWHGIGILSDYFVKAKEVWAAEYKGVHAVKTPKPIQDFLDEFDNDRIPELKGV